MIPKIAGTSWSPPEGLTKPRSDGWGNCVAKSRMCVSINERRGALATDIKTDAHQIRSAFCVYLLHLEKIQFVLEVIFPFYLYPESSDCSWSCLLQGLMIDFKQLVWVLFGNGLSTEDGIPAWAKFLSPALSIYASATLWARELLLLEAWRMRLIKSGLFEVVFELQILLLVSKSLTVVDCCIPTECTVISSWHLWVIFNFPVLVD